MYNYSKGYPKRLHPAVVHLHHTPHWLKKSRFYFVISYFRTSRRRHRFNSIRLFNRSNFSIKLLAAYRYAASLHGNSVFFSINKPSSTWVACTAKGKSFDHRFLLSSKFTSYSSHNTRQLDIFLLHHVECCIIALEAALHAALDRTPMGMT